MATNVSAVIITLNEERNIARCLESLQDIADEIIVVDSGSTDQTEAICNRFQAKFIKQTWLGYGAQKNHGNQLAQNDWILSVDADEALSPELGQSLLKLKKQNLSPNHVYRLNRLTNYCGHWIKHCGWYPDAKVRLFNRTCVQWNSAKIHEDIEFLKHCSTQKLKGDLWHYSYHTLNDHLKQINLFTDLTAQTAFQKGKKSPAWISIWFRAKWKFISDYVFRLGFLDGFAGFLVCQYSALATFTKYAKLKQLHETQKKQNAE